MLDDRFWAKVDKADPSGCWVWLANRNNKGYGLFRPGGVAPKALAHRLSFAESCGTIPKGRLVLHSCDNPSCVNPAHLRLGDHKANTGDMDTRARRNSNPRRGGANPSSRATDLIVANVRREYVSGAPFSDIVEKFALPLSAVKEYCIGKSFAHLYGSDGHPSREEMKAEAARRRRNAAKISAEDAANIRAALAAGETGRSVAQRYGIHFSTVSDIKRERIWPCGSVTLSNPLR
jgi:hypothetical protein